MRHPETVRVKPIWKLVCIIVLCQALNTYISNAQIVALPAIEHLTEKNGLPFSQVTQIVQDQQGFMWFAGPQGVCRYDGYSFKNINSLEKDSTTLWNNEIHFMTLHIDGSLLLGHRDGKISKLNPQTGKVKRLQFKGATGAIRTLFCDSRGTIWFSLHGGGVYRYKNDRYEFLGALRNFPAKADSNTFTVLQEMTRFFETKTGTVWLASNNGLYNIINDSINHVSHVSDEPKQGLFIHNILSEGDSIFWLPTYGNGIVRYEVETGKYQTYTFEKGWRGTYNLVYNATWRNKDEIWLTSWGLTSFNIRTKKFTFFYDKEDLKSLIISSNIYSDYNGTVWVAANGVSKYAPVQNLFQYNQLKVAKTDNGAGYLVNKVLFDSGSQRTILSTQLTEGLFIFDKDGHKTVLQSPLHPNGEPYQLFYALSKIGNGKLMALSRDYLFELTANNTLEIVKELNATLPTGIAPELVRFLETKNGDWYVGSFGFGLLRKKKGEKAWQRFHTENSGITNNRINGLVEDNNGSLWISHPFDGISHLNQANDMWRTFRHVEGDSTSIPQNSIVQIELSPDGNIWVSTSEGIAIIDVNTRKVLPLKLSNGSRLKPSYRLASDDWGNMWVVTAKHLVMVRPDFTFSAFDVHDGLQGLIPTFRIARTGHDVMHLGTYGGYFTFKPSELMKPQVLQSPMVFTEILNGNTPIILDENNSVQLEYSNSHISVSFAALNFLPGKNKYRYRIVELNNEWSDTSNPTVIYSGLPSGNFTFQAVMVDNPADILELNVTVSTPFYKTWWFRLSMVMVGIGGILLSYRTRLKQIRKEEKLKSEFNQKLAEAETKALKAQMSPHFIFNSLNSINRYIIKAEPEKASLYLTKFSKLIRLILDNSNQKIISLEQELLALKLYVELEALRFNERFTFSLQVASDISPNTIGVPPMIIQPFVENAIWHGLLHRETPGHLEIEFVRWGSGLKCTITDNGVGREKAAELKSKSVNKEKSYGMQITRERLDMMSKEGQAVEVVDLKDADGNALGTKVIVKIMGAELEPEF